VEQPPWNEWKGWIYSSKVARLSCTNVLYKIFLNKVMAITPFEQQAPPTNFE
jgi:hypothetical protein